MKPTKKQRRRERRAARRHGFRDLDAYRAWRNGDEPDRALRNWERWRRGLR